MLIHPLILLPRLHHIEMPNQFRQQDPHLRPRQAFPQTVTGTEGKRMIGFGFVLETFGFRRVARLFVQQPAFGDEGVGVAEIGGAAVGGPLGDADGNLVRLIFSVNSVTVLGNLKKGGKG